MVRLLRPSRTPRGTTEAIEGAREVERSEAIEGAREVERSEAIEPTDLKNGATESTE
jgi:hypothetical protein